MAVLQEALARVARRDQGAPVGFVPGGRQVGGRQVTVDEGALEVDADRDVEVVGDLVGAIARGGALDPVDGAQRVGRIAAAMKARTPGGEGVQLAGSCQCRVGFRRARKPL